MKKLKNKIQERLQFHIETYEGYFKHKDTDYHFSYRIEDSEKRGIIHNYDNIIQLLKKLGIECGSRFFLDYYLDHSDDPLDQKDLFRFWELIKDLALEYPKLKVTE